MLVNQAANALVGGRVPTFAGNDHPNIAPYGPVPCADRPLVVGAGNDAQFAALCAAVGLVRPARLGHQRRPGRRPGRAGSGAGAGLRRRGPQGSGPRCSTPRACRARWCRTSARCPRTRSVAAVGLVQRVDHPAGPLRVVGSPYRLDGERVAVRRPPPLLGQHTSEVLTALGLSAEQVEEVVHGRRGVRRWSPRWRSSTSRSPSGCPGCTTWRPGRRSPASAIRLVGVRHEQTAGLRRRRLRARDRPARRRRHHDRARARPTPSPRPARRGRATRPCWSSPPTSRRRCAAPGPVPRGAARDRPTRPSFFRPVTKEHGARRRASDELYDAGRAGRPPSRWRRPRRPVYVEVPTDLLSAPRRAPTGAARRSPAGPPHRSDDVPRPARRRPSDRCVWAGGGRRRRVRPSEVAALAERLGAPVLTSYGGRGLLPPDSPVPGGAAAARR